MMEDKNNSTDETDARGFFRSTPPQVTTTIQATPASPPVPMEVSQGAGVTVDPDSYDMTHPRRGKAVIINNKKFLPKTSMPERHGTDVDASALFQRFQELGFKVQMETNCTARQMQEILEKAANEDHTDADCFACVVLTHGEEGVVYGTDRTLIIEDLIQPFKKKERNTLIEKPKLFFIQACRGTKLDHGHEVCDAGEDDVDAVTSYRIPVEADFLIAYSVVPGYFSWRNSANGSWFAQALSRVLEDHGTTMELIEMLTVVNRKVAYDFQSNAAKEYMNKKKQIPCITSMLTKKVYFKPKSSD